MPDRWKNVGGIFREPMRTGRPLYPENSWSQRGGADAPGNMYGSRALTDQVLRSFAGYAVAPSLERRCLYAVAYKTKHADLEQFRPAFVATDCDGDGKISYWDLSRALEWAHGLSHSAELVDCDALFVAADLDNTGSITFVEFCAACLHSSLSPLDGWLAGQAFESMDDDADGWLCASDVRSIIGVLPIGLPEREQFGLQEWRNCLLGDGDARRRSRQCLGGLLTDSALVGTFFGTCAQPQPEECTGYDWEIEVRQDPNHEFLQDRYSAQKHGLDVIHYQQSSGPPRGGGDWYDAHKPRPDLKPYDSYLQDQGLGTSSVEYVHHGRR